MIEDEELYYFLLLYSVPNINYNSFNKIIDTLYFQNKSTIKDFTNLYKLSNCLLNAGITDNIANKILENFRNIRQVKRVQKIINYVQNNNIKYVTILDSHYPQIIKEYLKLHSPPILFYCGDITILNNQSISIVGSREYDNISGIACEEISRQLSSDSWNIVSGNARGIDSITHETSLKNGGFTTMILPIGIKSDDYDQVNYFISENHLLIISQFLPDEKWISNNALLRNKTINACSDITIVIDSKSKSGSLSCGLNALSLDKFIYSCRYKNIKTPEGNMFLIENGAFPLDCELINNEIIIDITEILDGSYRKKVKSNEHFKIKEKSTSKDVGNQPFLFDNGF